MIVAVDQPNYLPWKGYFDLINDVDLFVFYNNVQYTTRDWRNRNRIVTPNGEMWLTVPCGNDTNRLICDVKISNQEWQNKHYQTLKFAYGRTPYFKWINPLLEETYIDRKWDNLCELDMFLIERISKDYLGITTTFKDSRSYTTSGVKHERMLNLLDNIGADVYESGPAAKDYIISADYKKRGIKLRWKSYDNYPIYSQMQNTFSHYVSIIDLICNVGKDSPYYIWGWREGKTNYSWYMDEIFNGASELE